MKKFKLSVLVAVCAVLASCLVFSSCITIMEGSVHVKSADSGSVNKGQSSPQPLQKSPPVKKAPKTKYEKKDVYLNAGQTYKVTAPVNQSAGKRAECESSDSWIVVKDSENIVGSTGKGGAGTLYFIFKAMRGGTATVTLRQYSGGYLVLVREIRINVREPASVKGKSKSNSFGRKAPQ